MKLSIVDQSPVSAGSTAGEALQNTIQLARLADQLGYERYWVAEHHAMETLACPAPEILLARLGAETKRIRIGSGGILLPHYSPFKIVEVFRMLHALYPGRIDLGIGRAPGGTRLETLALRRDRKASFRDDFPDQLVELLAFLEHDFSDDNPFGQIKVSPNTPGGPELWLLGSSEWSASVAGQLGLPYAFAHFIDPQSTRAAIDLYRNEFRPARALKEPYAILALGAVCAETDEKAQFLHGSARALLRRFRQFPRDPGLVPAPEEAQAELSSGLDPNVFETGEWRRYVVGSPQTVRNRLLGIAEQLHIQELMIVTIVYDHRARMRSYELLADVLV